MKRVILALILLASAILACEKDVPTEVPTVPAVIPSAIPTATDIPPSVPILCVVRAAPDLNGALNLRAGPGTQYPVIIWLADGDEVRFVNADGAWDKVEADRDQAKVIGWVKAAYVECVK